MLRVSVQMWPSECYLGLEQLQSFCLHEGRSAKLACPKREHISAAGLLSVPTQTPALEETVRTPRAATRADSAQSPRQAICTCLGHGCLWVPPWAPKVFAEESESEQLARPELTLRTEHFTGESSKPLGGRQNDCLRFIDDDTGAQRADTDLELTHSRGGSAGPNPGGLPGAGARSLGARRPKGCLQVIFFHVFIVFLHFLQCSFCGDRQNSDRTYTMTKEKLLRECMSHGHREPG